MSSNCTVDISDAYFIITPKELNSFVEVELQTKYRQYLGHTYTKSYLLFI